MKPSLLFFDEGEAVSCSANVFGDINLSLLLPERTTAFLAQSCTMREAKARQAMFRALEDDSFYEYISELKGSMVTAAQAEASRRAAKCKCEELLRFRHYAEAYVKTHALALDMPPVSPLAENYLSILRAKAGRIAEVKQSIAETREAAETLSDTFFRFKPEGIYAIGGGMERDFNTGFKALAVRLGFDLPDERKASAFRMEPNMSDAICAIYKEQTAALEDFKRKYLSTLTSDLTDRRYELDFYLSITDLVRRASRGNIPSCLPELTEAKQLRAKDAFDVTLLVKDAGIVPNDIDFTEGDGVFFLTGANGGGKTTYLRAAAATALLASRGCPVFARSAASSLFQRVFTHFPADERFTGSGRLVEEENRVKEIIDNAAEGDIVFLNETYSGTDDKKGVEMTLQTTRTLRDRGVFVLYVTHFHEAAAAEIPSLNTVMDETDTSARTFRIIRSTALRSSFAFDILKKYSLDEDSLSERAGIKV